MGQLIPDMFDTEAALKFPYLSQMVSLDIPVQEEEQKVQSSPYTKYFTKTRPPQPTAASAPKSPHVDPPEAGKIPSPNEAAGLLPSRPSYSSPETPPAQAPKPSPPNDQHNIIEQVKLAAQHHEGQNSGTNLAHWLRTRNINRSILSQYEAMGVRSLDDLTMVLNESEKPLKAVNLTLFHDDRDPFAILSEPREDFATGGIPAVVVGPPYAESVHELETAFPGVHFMAVEEAAKEIEEAAAVLEKPLPMKSLVVRPSPYAKKYFAKAEEQQKPQPVQRKPPEQPKQNMEQPEEPKEATIDKQRQEDVPAEQEVDQWKEAYYPRPSVDWSEASYQKNPEAYELALQDFMEDIGEHWEDENLQEEISQYTTYRMEEQQQKEIEWNRMWQENHEQAEALLKKWEKDSKYRPFVELLNNSFGGVDEWKRKYYKTAFVSSLGNFPPTAIPRINQSVKEIKFFNSIADVSTAAVYSMREVYGDSKEQLDQLGKIYSGRERKQFYNEYMLLVEKARTDPREAALFHGFYKRLYFDSPNVPDSILQRSNSIYDIGFGDFDKMLSIYTHEITHAFDWGGTGNERRISLSSQWNEAWRREIESKSGGGHKLTRRASYSSIEGFAEMGRVLFSSKAPIEEIQKRFPSCLSICERCGLWHS